MSILGFNRVNLPSVMETSVCMCVSVNTEAITDGEADDNKQDLIISIQYIMGFLRNIVSPLSSTLM